MPEKKSDYANGHELVITRTFNAPRPLVWQVWTDPRHVTQWWGPRGFGNSSCEAALQVGGTFRLYLCAPDGNTYPCTGIFREIVEPQRIVYDSTADESHPCGAGLPPRSLVTVTFAEHGDKTTLTLHTLFENTTRKEAANRAGYSVSWGEALERLSVQIR
ncbi:MAG: SRPBCC domain-containing protein [Nitrosomonadales bacterium]|nr:SRPBCC domain-containing protein [Nitrosomonadales bacterium]